MRAFRLPSNLNFGEDIPLQDFTPIDKTVFPPARKVDTMKKYMLQIDMIAKFSGAGHLTPIRFKVPDTSGVIKIDRIIQQEEERLAGNRMLIYRCTSIIHGEERIFELKYEIGTCKWFLYKM